MSAGDEAKPNEFLGAWPPTFAAERRDSRPGSAPSPARAPRWQEDQRKAQTLTRALVAQQCHSLSQGSTWPMPTWEAYPAGEAATTMGRAPGQW